MKLAKLLINNHKHTKKVKGVELKTNETLEFNRVRKNNYLFISHMYFSVHSFVYKLYLNIIFLLLFFNFSLLKNDGFFKISEPFIFSTVYTLLHYSIDITLVWTVQKKIYYCYHHQAFCCFILSRMILSNSNAHDHLRNLLKNFHTHLRDAEKLQSIDNVGKCKW